MVNHISPSMAIAAARQIVTRDEERDQCYAVDRNYYLGSPQYNVLGTTGQFMEWCQSILDYCKPSTQAEVFEALLEAQADQYALCRLCGIAPMDFEAVRTGQLAVGLPFQVSCNIP